jgi:demethylmenaquinone methyltransferase / 2-methoxy-6-polyprenyl-1,4-benzoquinol methylase
MQCEHTFSIGISGDVQYIWNASTVLLTPIVRIRHVRLYATGFIKTLDTFPSSSEKQSSERRTYDTDFVRSLFDQIAHRYDFLNHLLSAGIDVLWRRRAVSFLRAAHPTEILDIATGTGDLAIEASTLAPRRIVGIDVAGAMLERAKKKVAGKHLEGIISFQQEAAERLSFPNESFDAVMVAFGVRNFADLEQGLREMLRVLKPNGVAVILEFSRPRTGLIRGVYRFYSSSILPVIGGLVSKSRQAYSYLPNTIREFPDGELFAEILRKTGFDRVDYVPQTFGIATIYRGMKPSQ